MHRLRLKRIPLSENKKRAWTALPWFTYWSAPEWIALFILMQLFQWKRIPKIQTRWPWNDRNQNREGMRIKSKICCDESIRKKFYPFYHSIFEANAQQRSLEGIKSGISINHAEKSHNHPDDYNMSQYILCGISWDDWTWENLESIASATHSKYNNESNTQVIQTISEYYIRIENRFLFWSIAKKTSEKTPIYVCFTVSGSFLILKTQFF